ncbi:hypothetical protein [Planctobacterium marinum]|uniref:Uncharacterized protein n=1 Tax=Planctobacterium marinum TaxID=1631968 RepID=A0AA48KR25_9ALTE|nr:hypothetical protein MACH26_05350 [Planctobacterium marinum]
MGNGRNNNNNSGTGRQRSGAVVQKPHLTRFDTKNETTPIQNMGRSKALSAPSRDKLVASFKANHSGVSSNNNEEKRLNKGALPSPNLLQTSQQHTNLLSNALNAGRTDMHHASQERYEKRNESTYNQMNRNQVSRKLHEASQGLSQVSLKPGQFKESLNQKRLESQQISQDTEKALSVKSRIKENNQEAWQKKTSAENWSTLATAVTRGGKIGAGVAAVTGAGAASGLISVGANATSAAANERAAKQFGKSADLFNQNVDDSKQGTELLDSNISAGMSELSRAQADQSHGKAKGQAVGAVVGALGSAPGVDNALQFGIEQVPKQLNRGVQIKYGLDLSSSSSSSSSLSSETKIDNAEAKIAKTLGTREAIKRVTKREESKTNSTQRIREGKTDVINNMLHQASRKGK